MSLYKTPLEIMQEAAETESFSVTDMLKDEIKAEFKGTYSEIGTVEESIQYRAEMIPVIESADRQTYYVEMDNIVKYMRSGNVRDVQDALYDIAESSDLSIDDMTIVIESDDYADSVLNEAQKAAKLGDDTKLKKLKSVSALIKSLKTKGIKVAKKKSAKKK